MDRNTKGMLLGACLFLRIMKDDWRNRPLRKSHLPGESIPPRVVLPSGYDKKSDGKHCQSNEYLISGEKEPKSRVLPQWHRKDQFEKAFDLFKMKREQPQTKNSILIQPQCCPKSPFQMVRSSSLQIEPYSSWPDAHERCYVASVLDGSCRAF
jgi:hypothetical protein